MLVVSDAIVLHAFDYLETSRILRLLTRETGVQSALAKGARRGRGRVGSAVDLFAEGEVQLYVKPARELHTLGAFDVTISRAALALDLDRFMAASAIAELVLRLGSGEAGALLYETVAETLDSLAAAAANEVGARALAGAWRIVAASGFTPSLDECAGCHAILEPGVQVTFSHSAGGGLCDRCARMAPAGRRLPADARDTLREWLLGGESRVLAGPGIKAHMRLLREFLAEHVSEGRPLRAFAAWESSLPVF